MHDICCAKEHEVNIAMGLHEALGGFIKGCGGQTAV